MSLGFARPWRSSSNERGALASLAAASSAAVPRAAAINTEASEVKAAILALVAHFDQSRDAGDTVPGAARGWRGEVDIPTNPDGSIRADKPIEVHHADILRRESVRGVGMFVSTVPTLSRDHPGEEPLYLSRAGRGDADKWIEGESVRDCAGHGVLVYVPWYLSWRGARLAVVFRASFRDEDRPGQYYPQLLEGSPEYYPRTTAPTRYDAPHAKMTDYVLIGMVEERVRKFLGAMDCAIEFRGARLKDQQLEFGGLLGGSINQSQYRTALHLEVRLKGIWRRVEVPQERCTSGHDLPVGDVSPQYVFGLPGADLVEDRSGPLHCFKRARSGHERVLRHRSTASDTWTFLSRTTARHGGHEHVVATQWSMTSLALRDGGDRVPLVVTFALALDEPFQVRRRGSDEKGRQVLSRPRQ
ncbi:hypothetical protein JCM8208_001468 [Rhodotorula glutinis]